MARSRRLLCFILLSTLSITYTAAATDCFVPNGTDRNVLPDVSPDSIEYVPCNQVNPFSMCCRYGADECLPNGLCQGDAGDGRLPVWRESCTDPTWTSPFCLKLCIKGKTPNGPDCTYLEHVFRCPMCVLWKELIRQLDDDTDVIVHECPDGGFCCGYNNNSCCGTAEAQYIVDGQVTNVKPGSTTTTSSSSTSSSTSTSNATAITDQANSPATPQSNGNGGGTNVGAIAGGVIGGVVALALVGTAIWFFKGRRKQQQYGQPAHHAQDLYYPPPKSPASPRYHVHPGLHEAYGSSDSYDTYQLDSQEKHEIGYQQRDRILRQELE
ncbi:MAG: hypothetical protein Q9192_003105 [Flavoplaca navasiana]